MLATISSSSEGMRFLVGWQIRGAHFPESRMEEGDGMPTVRVGDISMYYVEAGAGEALVLVMGLGADHLAWGFQFPVFAEKYRVIAFDNRGAGQTDVPDQPYTTRMMANDTVGLMDTLGVDRAHVLGVSMGGMVAQEIALNHPE